MPPQPAHRSIEFFQSLPKVERHHHLEGSLQLVTLLEMAHAHGLVFPGTFHLRLLVQVHSDDPNPSQNFLAKFETLRRVYRSPQVIACISREIIADAGADNIRYLELRFSPAALKKAEDFPLAEVIDWPSRAPSAPRRQRGQPSCLKQNAPARQPCSRGSSQATGSGFRAWR